MAADKKRKKYLVADVLPALAQMKGWREKLDLHSFFPIWEDVVDTDVSGCSRPLKVVKDVLWLEVENSTWMQELQYKKFQILDDVNSTLQYTRIRDIKFILESRKDEPVRYELPPVVYVSPDPEAVKEFERQVREVVEDEVVRESLVRLWYLSKACRRERKKE